MISPEWLERMYNHHEDLGVFLDEQFPRGYEKQQAEQAFGACINRIKEAVHGGTKLYCPFEHPTEMERLVWNYCVRLTEHHTKWNCSELYIPEPNPPTVQAIRKVAPKTRNANASRAYNAQKINSWMEKVGLTAKDAAGYLAFDDQKMQEVLAGTYNNGLFDRKVGLLLSIIRSRRQQPKGQLARPPTTEDIGPEGPKPEQDNTGPGNPDPEKSNKRESAKGGIDMSKKEEGKESAVKYDPKEIQALIEKSGLKVKQISKATGVHPANIYQMKNGVYSNGHMSETVRKVLMFLQTCKPAPAPDAPAKGKKDKKVARKPREKKPVSKRGQKPGSRREQNAASSANVLKTAEKVMDVLEHLPKEQRDEVLKILNEVCALSQEEQIKLSGVLATLLL